MAVERLAYDEDKAFTLADDAATIARIVRTTPTERLRTTVFGEWSALEVIGHLADTSEIFADRIQRCVDEERPTLLSFDQEALAAERRNNERDPMDLSRRLSAAHSRVVQLLQRPGLPGRPAVHSDWGDIDAGHLATYLAQHAHAHATELAERFPPVR